MTYLPENCWTCPSCGSAVPNGVTHCCNWNLSNFPSPSPAPLTEADVRRIIREELALRGRHVAKSARHHG